MEFHTSHTLRGQQMDYGLRSFVAAMQEAQEGVLTAPFSYHWYLESTQQQLLPPGRAVHGVLPIARCILAWSCWLASAWCKHRRGRHLLRQPRGRRLNIALLSS